MSTKTCPTCGMTDDKWVYNGGKGYQGKYCCPGCAKGTGCECGGGSASKAEEAQAGKGR